MNSINQQSRPMEMNENSYHGDISDEDMKLIKHLTWLYGGYSMRRRNVSDLYEKEESLNENVEAVQVRSKGRPKKDRGKQQKPYMDEKNVTRGRKTLNKSPNQHPGNKLQKKHENWNGKQKNRSISKVLLENDEYIMIKGRKVNTSKEYMLNERKGRNKCKRNGIYNIMYEENELNNTEEGYLTGKKSKTVQKRKNKKRGLEYSSVHTHGTGIKIAVIEEEDGKIDENGIGSKEKRIGEGGGNMYDSSGVQGREVDGSVEWSNKDDIAWKLENARYLLNRRLKYYYEMEMNDRRNPSWPINYSLQNKIEDFISKKIADATEFRSKEPTTLSICNQFALQNHEAMVADSDRVHYYRAAIFWTGYSEDHDSMEKDMVNIEVNNIDSTVDAVDMNRMMVGHVNVTKGGDLDDVITTNVDSTIIGSVKSTVDGDMEGRAQGMVTLSAPIGGNNAAMETTTDVSNYNEECDAADIRGNFGTNDTTPSMGGSIEEGLEYKGGFENLESIDGGLNECFEKSFKELETLHSKFTSNLDYKTGGMAYENGLSVLPQIETSLNTCYSDSLHSRSTSVNLDSSIYNESEDTISSVNGGVKYYCTGKKILEIGTGPMCVLAMNALKAGAKSVDALEVSDHASRLAGKLMAAYGFDNIIKVFNTHSKQFIFNQNEYFAGSNSNAASTITMELSLPAYPPYDMVISEILGDFASQEGVADVFLDFQRRILFENKAFLDEVKSIPCRVSTMFVPSFFPDASNILNKSSSDREMTIFSPSKKMLQSVGMRIDNLPVCEEWRPLEHIDLESWMLPQMCQHYVNVFKVAKFGEVAGLLVGIDVEIRPGEHFGTRYGQCESWYTNLLMFDREYTVFEKDLIVVSSVANLTNYTKVNCDTSKIQVSRPSYSFRAYILSPINFEAANFAILQTALAGNKVTANTKNYSDDTANDTSSTTIDHSTDSNNSGAKKNGTTVTNGTNGTTVKGQYSVKLKCKELKEMSYDVTNRTKINFYNLNKTHEAVSTKCKCPDDILEGQEYVQLEGEIYKVIHRPEVIYIDYDEQTSTIYYDTPCAKRKMHTDPPKRYNKIKLKTAKSM
ncbi:conserved hypothetical protein [Theileria orientalis strain Shintoku]|uniref:Uncharacterized protein n=1 Tax=Theileria orientalis strain Shintoku TaxID=869250 RepID=J4DPD1_THEOR|nr:conserved hypothetical protein [Theileria orientalis strain Shintoku]BAM40494.1 conserved hypothetical protein [Theileria orientalis strain Shintoku]|eukprot:XP_009690795.1 conserved hypothetical protein [Theileria orientalis strain Shintoku]